MLAAAIDLLGDGGAKAMTHRGVDRAAGVPMGTTANHFRTAESLVRAVAAELERLDTEQWQRAAQPNWRTIDDAARDMARFAGALTRPPQRNLTRARILLSVTHPDIVGAAHLRLRRFFQDAVGIGLDLEIPPETVVTLAGLIDGMILHHVTVDSEPLDEPALADAIRCLVQAMP